MTIQVENPSILESLCTLLNAIDGVKIVKTTQTTSRRKDVVASDDDIPNEITLAAMQEVADDDSLECVNMENLEEFTKSMR